MIYNFGPFFPQFWDNDVTKEINIREFWELNLLIGFDLLKMQIARSIEISIVPWSGYITLKQLWETLEKYIIKGLQFHVFYQAFCKNFLILMFWKNYSPLVPNLIMIDKNLAPCKESCISFFTLYLHNIRNQTFIIEMAPEMKRNT